MIDPEADHEIQPPPNSVTPSVPVGGEIELSLAEDSMSSAKLGRRILSPGMLFGGLVGLLMGVLVGVACCWILRQSYLLWPGALVGAAVGPFGGAVIGMRERQTRGALARPDVATLICVVYGLVPALLILLRSVGFVKGRFSGYMFLGAVAVGPMLGLVIGAMLDRAYEAGIKRLWGTALGFGIAGVAACLGLAFALARNPAGPNPKDVAAEVRPLILHKWGQVPELRGVTIREINLEHHSGNLYTGFVDAALGGRAERLRLEVRFDDTVLELALKPMNE